MKKKILLIMFIVLGIFLVGYLNNSDIIDVQEVNAADKIICTGDQTVICAEIYMGGIIHQLMGDKAVITHDEE